MATLLEKLLDLSEKGEIKFTPRQLKKMSEERLEEIYQSYEQKELDATNELISDMLIIKFEDILKSANMIKKESALARKLQDRTMFKKDLKNIVGYFTPLLPFIGLVEGLVVTSSEIIENYNTKNEGASSTFKEGKESNSTPGSESEHDE